MSTQKCRKVQTGGRKMGSSGGAKENSITLELTALGVGARTIGGKTYVAIGFELTNTTP